MSSAAPLAVWSISAATIAAILLRPWRIGEWVWAVCGAVAIVAAGLLPALDAGRAALDGLNVYLFLAGMLALAEIARTHGIFDRLAGLVLQRGAGAPASRALAWVFLAGIGVTALLSNDGTIMLLTPAALALARAGDIDPLPLLYACAFVANAASFVLPISNPANLVVFRQLPALGAWFAAFGLPSLAAIASTYALLWLIFRAKLRGAVACNGDPEPLSRAGKAALVCVSISTVVVVAAAALSLSVGLTAFAAGAASLIVLAFFDRGTPMAILRGSPWSVVPLVAGLFVIVSALDRTGALRSARELLHFAGTLPPVSGNMLTGGAVTLADAAINNLPVGVLARYALASGALPAHIAHATLIGVDLGPNLSMSGSLATLLWAMMLRRDDIHVNGWQFLRIGACIALPALALSLLCAR